MGVLPVDYRIISIAGVDWELDANTTTDDMSRSDGTLQILARQKGSSDWTHCCHVPLQHSPPNFLERFANAFVAFEEFRNECEQHAGGSRIDKETDFGTRSPKVPASPAPKIEQAVTRIVKLGKKAKFSDYASLRSGRDKFSSAKEADLTSLLGDEVDVLDDVIKQKGVEFEPSARVKMLRWMARGLPSDMALRKILTDFEIAKNSRPRK
jgi:hypothetical protein